MGFYRTALIWIAYSFPIFYWRPIELLILECNNKHKRKHLLAWTINFSTSLSMFFYVRIIIQSIFWDSLLCKFLQVWYVVKSQPAHKYPSLRCSKPPSLCTVPSADKRETGGKWLICKALGKKIRIQEQVNKMEMSQRAKKGKTKKSSGRSTKAAPHFISNESQDHPVLFLISKKVFWCVLIPMESTDQPLQCALC